MARFFTAFPKTIYNNQYCVDLIRSTHLTREAVSDTRLYYDVTPQEGTRPDALAYNYYDDPFYDWMVYYANKIIDPYFDWYLPQRQFEQFIVDEYGSAAEALEKVAYYKVNYESDKRQLTSAEYQALSVGQRKYWRPKDEFSSSFYVRKELDWQVNTNQIIKLTLSIGGSTAITASDWFSTGMYVHQLNGIEVVASGEVAQVSGNSIMLKNINGGFVTTSEASYPLSAPIQPSTEETTILVESNTVLVSNIPLDEMSYWQPESYYDHEEERNEYKKTVRLINKVYLRQIQENHETSLGNTE